MSAETPETTTEPGQLPASYYRLTAADRELTRAEAAGMPAGVLVPLVDALSEAVSEYRRESGSPCPAGCGCRLGTDDADARECGCDGGCCDVR